MSFKPIPSDNLHLSEPKTPLYSSKIAARAISCIGYNFDHTSQFFIQNSIAENSRRAYLSDLREFEKAGFSIPAAPEAVAQYLAESASSLRVATLVRRLASLSKAHEARGLPNPTRSPLVRATLRGIKRTYGCAQRQAKPLCRDDLLQVLDATGDSRKDLRDRALLLVGFAGALRRSELVAINIDDLEHVRQGIVLHLPHSKTDQEGEGQKIGIPYGRGRWCPVAALHDWLQTSAIDAGAIFRPLDRAGRVASVRLSRDAVSLIVRHRVETAGLDPSGYSGHSLRAGLATSASQVGVPTWKIRAQTRHASDAMLARYVRDGALFSQNAAAALL
ncbi:site-specific integrase [Bradyrhizobium sp. 18]|uniref:site-specific integrase n=1 Tax=Bradyrhizobium sp. 18 TaxID=2782657 RepID=UPI001FFC0D36|nr:site-specific integrase [Bradyrhizobium sp. 18]MCK1506318.1 site-specific integrase [Bradyrhizobium sp. 18]